MSDQDLYIVELLTRPDGPSYKRSLPKSKEDANRLAASLEVSGVHTKVVPAEKYAPKGRVMQTETPENVRANEHRSRVE